MSGRFVPGNIPTAVTACLRLACALFATTLLGSCVYLPETTTRYNADCGIYERRVTLEVHQVGVLTGCRDEGCVTALVFAGVVSAGTAVVSGSVMVVGNVAYWLEKQGHCLAAGQKADRSGSSPAK